jgi:hypothetical protein
MIGLHDKVRTSGGSEIPIKFLVANGGLDNEPTAPTGDEKREWAQFVDSLRDPAAEVYFFDA